MKRQEEAKSVFAAKKKEIVQFLKFGLVGLSNSIVLLLVYYAITAVWPSKYLLGNTLGWLASVANAFWWNNRFVFQKREESAQTALKRLGKSYLSYGATFLISQGLLYLELEIWGIPNRVAPIINIIITTPLNFIVNKFWTFS